MLSLKAQKVIIEETRRLLEEQMAAGQEKQMADALEGWRKINKGAEMASSSAADALDAINPLSAAKKGVDAVVNKFGKKKVGQKALGTGIGGKWTDKLFAAARKAAKKAAKKPATDPNTKKTTTKPKKKRVGTRGVQFRLAKKLGITIKDIQRALEAAGFSPGKIDGVSGPKTKAAIRAFQESEKCPKCKVDGIVGPETWPNLKAPRPSKEKLAPDPTSPEEMRKDADLKKLGLEEREFCYHLGLAKRYASQWAAGETAEGPGPTLIEYAVKSAERAADYVVSDEAESLLDQAIGHLAPHVRRDPNSIASRKAAAIFVRHMERVRLVTCTKAQEPKVEKPKVEKPKVAVKKDTSKPSPDPAPKKKVVKKSTPKTLIGSLSGGSGNLVGKRLTVEMNGKTVPVSFGNYMTVGGLGRFKFVGDDGNMFTPNMALKFRSVVKRGSDRIDVVFSHKLGKEKTTVNNIKMKRLLAILQRGRGKLPDGKGNTLIITKV